MRHGKTDNHLGRTTSHRRALLSNMASSLILHKRITTTVAKAKELRKYVEPLLTKSKEDSTNSRRVVFSYLQNKDSVKELFDNVAEKISSRPGGYTRIIKLGNRLGDNADVCIIELVDYNELLLKDSESKTKTTRRSRRGSSTTKKAEVTEVATSKEDIVDKQEQAEETVTSATLAEELNETVENNETLSTDESESAANDMDDTDDSSKKDDKEV